MVYTVRLTHSHSGVWGAGDDSRRHGNNLRPEISYCTLPLSNPTHIQATKGGTVREREREGGRERERERERERWRGREEEIPISEIHDFSTHFDCIILNKLVNA